MEGTTYSGITEVTTLLLLHRRGVDNLTNTKLHANFNVLTGEDPCTKIELSLEVNPTALGPLSGLLTGICGLQGMHQLAREYYAISVTPLVVKLLACINGVTTECYTGTPSCGGEGSHVIRRGSSPSLPSHTGICITVELPIDSSCAWTCAKYTARYFHLLCVANTKVEFMVSYHGNGQHRIVEYHSMDHMTVNRQGHTLMIALHPHYHYDPSLSNRRNRLHTVWGKKQMISGITVLSGDTMTLQLSVACAAVPGLPSLARGKKLPADRLCRAIHMVVYGPGGVPIFPPSSSNRGLLLSQVVNWEDYGVAIGNPCCAESTGNDNFDQTVIPSFSNELVVTKDPTRASVVERNSSLYVFLFIEAAVESVDVSSTDSVGHQLRSLQMLQHNLQDIQLSHLKQFRMAFHTSLNKLLCNYNSFSKINLTLEEAIPSVSEAVASIVSHSREESFQHSCHSVMEVEPTRVEVQQWLTDRLWRIASDKLGARYHNGQLIRAAEEPDTPDIAAITAATTSHQPSLALHDSDNTLVADVEEESVVMVSRRRCYHPSVASSHHYTSQTDSTSSQPDCVMPTDSFITLDTEDLDWSDTNCTADSDITDDELWSDDDTVVNDGPLWDDNDVATHTIDTIPITAPLSNTLIYTSTSDDPLLQGEVMISSNSDIITTNEISEDTRSTNEITANDVSPNGSSESSVTGNTVIPIEVPSILTCDEALEQIAQDGAQVMEGSSQNIALLPVCSLSENANTCFDELADLLSSPEEDNISSSKSLATSNTIIAASIMTTGDNLSIIEDQYLMEQFSSNDLDDDFADEDLDWN